MSLRNGHRSRENVLRRARILRRLKISQLRESLAKQTPADKPAAAAKKAPAANPVAADKPAAK
jgi:hypothetical protein